MKGLLVILAATAGAGLGVMLVTRYGIKATAADGTATQGFIPVSDGFGLDDLAQGAGALAGGWAAAKVARMVLGKVG